jgi:hypothetical protein
MLGANHDTVIITFNGIPVKSYLAPNIEQGARNHDVSRKRASTKLIAAQAANFENDL